MIDKKSFTLIELMVSLSVLVMVIMSAMGIYIHVIGTREKALGQLNIQEEGQYLMSLIVKDVRASKVDYDDYIGTSGNCVLISSASTPVSQLCLLDFSSTQKQIRYIADLSSSGNCSQDRCVLQRCEGNAVSDACNTDSGDYQNITMTNVSIERLDFYIDPSSDPFTAGSTVYSHPRVTVVLKLKSLVEKPGMSPLIIQQTIPQRYTFRK